MKLDELRKQLREDAPACAREVPARSWVHKLCRHCGADFETARNETLCEQCSEDVLAEWI